MKNVIIALLVGATVVSCTEKGQKNNVESNVMLEEPTASTTSATAGNEGLTLIQGMDCMGCHKESEKLVGPSYQEIANKYTDGDTDMLAQKIIDGGSGNWGAVPMTPHAGLSKDNAKKMVEYILSLKK